MGERRSVSTGRRWEEEGGYSRAVRAGDRIEVSGTAASNAAGEMVSPGDVYLQTMESLRIIGGALGELEASFDDVIRTRIMLSDPARWEDASRAHLEILGAIRPAFSFVFVQPSPHGGSVVEVEALAVVAGGGMRGEGASMHERRSVLTGRYWEEEGGYSRAVHVGSLIEVSGTAPSTLDGQIIAPGDVYQQTRESLRIIGEALAELGASYEDVVRTRFHLSDSSRHEEASRAHVEVFGTIRPAFSFVFVQPYPIPGLMIEVEATAVFAGDS